MFNLYYYWLVVATFVLLLEYAVCVSSGHGFILILQIFKGVERERDKLKESFSRLGMF